MPFKPSINTWASSNAGHEAAVSPTLGETHGEKLQEDITVPPKLDIPSPGSKVIEALEDKAEDPSASDEAADMQITKAVEHDASISMKGLVEDQQKAIESEVQVKLEIDTAKGKDPKLPPIMAKTSHAGVIPLMSPIPEGETPSLSDAQTETGMTR